MVSPTDPLCKETIRPMTGVEYCLDGIIDNEKVSDPIVKEKIKSNVGMVASLLALKHVETFVETSKSYSETYEKALPRLARYEMSVGKLLGKGGFSDVYEITSFPLVESEEKEDEDQSASREFLKKHVHRGSNNDCRYAVKYLREDTMKDNEMFKVAAMDLALEAKILCSVFHPNIVKLRGLCSDGEMGYSKGGRDGFFLILDRLYDTLDNRIDTWLEEEKNAPKKSSPKKTGSKKGLKKLFGSKTAVVDEISTEKLKIIRDMIAAVQYLHKRRIIYRDLKPENFGFDIRGDVKLFDFGLSKEISSCKQLEDGTYKLTGGIGTQRYMAPEVIRHDTYNLSADTYSFAVMLWEMLSMKPPFAGFNSEQHAKLVAYGTYRPEISKKFPPEIKALISIGWSSNLHERPSFQEMFDMFTEMLTQNESCKNDVFSTRRSTHLMLRNSQIKDLLSSTKMTRISEVAG